MVQAQVATSGAGAVISPESVPPGARLLHFPRERSLGRLYIQDANLKREIESFHYWINGTGWETLQYLGEARGDVVIPEGKRVYLYISHAGARDLSPLDRLDPDSFFGVRPDAELSDKALVHLARLTGLRELNLEGYASRETTRLTPAGLNLLKELKSLEYLTLPSHVTDGHLASLADMRSLKGLYFRENNLVTNEGLAALAALDGLEELELLGDRVSDAGLAHIARLPRLTYLILRGTTFTDAGMAHVAKISSLRILNLQNVPVGDGAAAHISRMAALERLSLHNTRLTDAGMHHLIKLRDLRYLGLDRTQVTTNGLMQLKALRKLEYLGLPTRMATDALVDELTRLPRLRHLDLPETYSPDKTEVRYSDKSLKKIADRLPDMQELSIGGHGITDAGLVHVARLKNLKRLFLFGVPNITNEGLASLASISTLENLDLTDAEKITTRGVNHLNRLTDLQLLRVTNDHREGFCDDTLNLSSLKQVRGLWLSSARDQDVACLAGLHQLEKLTFERNSAELGDAGMAQLASLTNLTNLQIAGQPAATDRGLANLTDMKKLELLSVTGNFTNAGLRHLEGLAGLRSLYVKSPNTFSPAALQRLRASLPNVFTFDVAGNRPFTAPKNVAPKTKVAESPSAANEHPKPGTPAPSFDVTTLDGKPWRLADQRGKVVLLHFWSTSCAPCMAGLPGLNTFHAQLKQKFGDRVIMIGLTSDDSEPWLRQVIEEKAVNWPQARIGMMSKIAADYGVDGEPDDFLIGPDGKVLLNRESPDGTDTIQVIAEALK
jgi:peroxiredoxin